MTDTINLETYMKISSGTGKIEESDLVISRRIKAIFDAGQITQEELAKALSITQPHVSRLLLGKSAWRKKYIDKFIKLYNISINTVMGAQEVPIYACVKDDEGFKYSQVCSGEAIGMAPAPPSEEHLEGVYCLKIEGDFFRPHFREGTLLYCRKGESPDLQEDNIVVYVDAQGIASLRQVIFNGNFLILKSPSPSGNYLVVSKTNLRMLDKVEWIRL